MKPRLLNSNQISNPLSDIKARLDLVYHFFQVPQALKDNQLLITHLRVMFCDVDTRNKTKSDPSGCCHQRHFPCLFI